MTLRTFPVLHVLSDSLFADRVNRIDRLLSQLTGSTPLPSTCRAGKRANWKLKPLAVS